MPVALILVDALPPTYVSASVLPAVTRIGETGRAGPLVNMYAYRGIEATLFSGFLPSAHGVWGEFVPADHARPARLPLRLAGAAMVKAGDLLPSDRLRLDARYIAGKITAPGGHAPTANLIPQNLMGRFTTAVETPIWEPGSLGPVPTLFDELRAADMLFETITYPRVRTDRDIPGQVTRRASHSPLPDFWFIKFGALDGLGHRYGPDVEALRPALGLLNAQLDETIASLYRVYGPAGIDIAIVSDHGMSQVTVAHDVRPTLRQIRSTVGKDFLYFLDSTAVRIWDEDSGVLSAAAEAFGQVPGLTEVNEDARRDHHLPVGHQTGDLLVTLAEGHVIAPDFFRRDAAPRGMHGYARVETESGLPMLAAAPEIAALLPPRTALTHLDVWSAVRERLDLGHETLDELDA